MIQKPKCLRHTHISKINSPKFSDEGISGLYTPKLQKIQNPNLNSAQIINIQLSCDVLSARVWGISSYLVYNLTSPGRLRKGLKGKRFPYIITEVFSERLAKGFVGTLMLSVFQWE